jgi:predicted nucleic acid-binding protein
VKVILDANIVIDVLEKREPFFHNSYEVLKMSIDKKIDAYVSANCMTDIHYIVRKNVADKGVAKEAMIQLAELVCVCDTLGSDITASHALDMSDYEDAVLAATAKREKADYIVTRNKRDFANSPVPAVLPEELLELLVEQAR